MERGPPGYGKEKYHLLSIEIYSLATEFFHLSQRACRYQLWSNALPSAILSFAVIFHFPFAIHRLLLAILHLLFATCHMPFYTAVFPFAICRLAIHQVLVAFAAGR